MAGRIKVTSNLRQAARAARKAQAQYRQGLALTMWRAMAILEAQVKQNIRTTFNVGTGRMLNSPKTYVEQNGDVLTGSISMEGIPYAAIHEFGGVIRAKKSNFLIFAASENRRPDGLPIIEFKDFMAQAKRDRAMIPLKKGGWLSAQKLAGGGIIPRFILKKEVTIPARPYLMPALEKTSSLLEERFGLFLESAYEFKE